MLSIKLKRHREYRIRGCLTTMMSSFQPYNSSIQTQTLGKLMTNLKKTSDTPTFNPIIVQLNFLNMSEVLVRNLNSTCIWLFNFYCKFISNSYSHIFILIHTQFKSG